MPTTLSSRPHPAAIWVIDSVEVLEAKIVLVLANPIQLIEELLLDFKVLEDRLNNQIAVSQVVEIGRVMHPRQCGIALARVHSAALHRFPEKLLCRFA